MIELANLVRDTVTWMKMPRNNETRQIKLARQEAEINELVTMLCNQITCAESYQVKTPEHFMDIYLQLEYLEMVDKSAVGQIEGWPTEQSTFRLTKVYPRARRKLTKLLLRSGCSKEFLYKKILPNFMAELSDMETKKVLDKLLEGRAVTCGVIHVNLRAPDGRKLTADEVLDQLLDETT